METRLKRSRRTGARTGAGTRSLATAVREDIAPGRSDEARGRDGDGAGRSDEARGRNGDGPGRSGEAPGRNGDGPGRSGEAPGRSGDGAGRSAKAPLNNVTTPTRSDTRRDKVSSPVQRARTDRAAPPRSVAGAQLPEPVQAAAAPRIRPVYRTTEREGSRARQEEISVVGLNAASRNALGALGFSTITSRRSTLLGGRDVSRLRTPRGMSPQAAALAVRQRYPGLVADLSHLYRPAAAQNPTSVRYAQELVGIEGSARCVVNVRIGLVDTGTGRHATLGRIRMIQRSFVDHGAGTNALHGTAVASLLVGSLPGVQPLLPGARLYSANVFAGQQQVLAADVTAIIEALDWMAKSRVRVVNLSLIGPPNALLEAAVAGAARKGLILVAAGGNDGPSAPPVYPAAYPAVIAVAAVDQRSRPYSGNNRGSYVQISAPGVDIWAADGRGGEAFWTGTSFAVPFVTAALAREVAAGTVRHIDDARRFLSTSARDLGPRGRDPIYGYGLLQARSCG